MKRKIPHIIAIDGPGASGKSTLAEKLAADLGYLFFDTGIMYRAVTLAALRKLGSVDDEEKVSTLSRQVQIDARPPTMEDGRKYDVLLDGEDVTNQIRDKEVEKCVSMVSAYSVVRQEMTEQQRRIGCRGRVVMVGRDIGTVVLPEADLKIYLDASDEERAQRRYAEYKQQGKTVKLEEIIESLRQRDRIDSTRSIAPLVPADDAIIINSDGLNIDDVLKKVKELVEG